MMAFEISDANPLIGVLLGGIIAWVPTIIQTCLNNKAAKDRQVADLVYKAAIEDYKTLHETIRARPRRAAISPLMSFICHHWVVNAALTGDKLNVDDLENRLSKAHTIASELVARLEQEDRKAP